MAREPFCFIDFIFFCSHRFDFVQGFVRWSSVIHPNLQLEIPGRSKGVYGSLCKTNVQGENFIILKSKFAQNEMQRSCPANKVGN